MARIPFLLHINGNILCGYDLRSLSSLGQGESHLLPVRLCRDRGRFRHGTKGIRNRDQADRKWGQPIQELFNLPVRCCGFVLHPRTDELFQQGTQCLPAVHVSAEHRIDSQLAFLANSPLPVSVRYTTSPLRPQSWRLRSPFSRDST